MAFRLGAEMMEEIGREALSRGRCIVLVKHQEQAEKVSLKIRTAIREELMDNPDNYTGPRGGRPPMLKPLGNNLSFIQITNGGWVFVWPADDMDANEEIGQPQFVYWPSEGGAYEKVTYDLWKLNRLAGTIYRPMTVATPKKKTPGRPTAWDRLLSEDDDQ
jgi:hypothetical protein